MADDSRLRSEIRRLGELLGATLREQAGDKAFDLVEDIRALAKARRRGERRAEGRLAKRVASLKGDRLSALIQALSVFFDIANLAEERHRVRVIRRRRRKGPSPGTETVHDAVMLLRRARVPASAMQALLNSMVIEFVFTAHPTEAKRRSIREKIRDLREHLGELDGDELLPSERNLLLDRVRADLAGLWQTDFVRFRRPSVLEELDRSLFFAGNLWHVTPRLYRDLRSALADQYPGQAFVIPPLLRFGTWIGGDRDGNPNVTAEVTRRALATLRRDAIRRHVEQARRTRRALSMSSRKAGVSDELTRGIAESIARWPDLEDQVGHLSENEPYRRWLRIVQWRLERSLGAEMTGEIPAGAYAGGREFVEDLRLMRRSLGGHRGEAIAQAHVDDWICQAEVFGLHLMRLDVRQESSWYHGVLAHMLPGALDYGKMDESARQQALADSSWKSAAPKENHGNPAVREAMTLFRLLASVCAMSGPESLGAHVISMTHQPSDVLAVLWLSRWAARAQGLPGDRLPMPIAPLFETIDDLKRAPQVLGAMLMHPAYAEHVRETGHRQIVMIGYSDSTKDGGYLSACWELHDAQLAMQRVAEAHGVQIVFFHGRGGSLGRGGGPAARSILSLPGQTLRAGLRMTEQGEVLAERYDDPHIAHRHLEQVVSATLACAGGAVKAPPPSPRERALLADMSERSRRAYRELVEETGFIDYFEQATPITQVEQLPIGSRPARRRADRSLATLRAIPWVFSWTQCRHMIPAWYGLGTALDLVLNGRGGPARLVRLYRNSPFFRATIDNAALALAKADMGIARLHAELVADADSREAIWSRIAGEFDRTRRAVLRITQQRRLLADIPWLKRSIEVRNPYVDPLNFIQIELFRRLRALPADSPRAPATAELIRLSIQGIAGGLRTTG